MTLFISSLTTFGHICKSFKSKDLAKYVTYYVVFFILMFHLVFVALTSKDKPGVEILGQCDLSKSSRKGRSHEQNNGKNSQTVPSPAHQHHHLRQE